MSAKRPAPIKEEEGACPEDEETAYYPDFYDPALLCVPHRSATAASRPAHSHTRAVLTILTRAKLPKSAGRTNIIGHVPGVRVGKTWNFRSQCSNDLVHRPWVAGAAAPPPSLRCPT